MDVKNSPDILNEAQSSPPSLHSRRHLMRLAAMGGISLAGMRFFSPKSLFAATPAAAVDLSGGPTDGATQFAGIPGNSINEQVLNFALTLEILESDLYRQALNIASGIPVNDALSSNPNVYKLKVGGGGLNSISTQAGYLYLKQFAYVEAAHREFLIAAITAAGLTPTKKNPGGYKFPTQLPANLKGILTAILPLEETGVRAYLGALPYLTDLGLAQVAGSIYSTEARHSAAVSVTLGLHAGPAKRAGDQSVVANAVGDNTFEYYLPPKAVVAAAVGTYFV